VQDTAIKNELSLSEIIIALLNGKNILIATTIAGFALSAIFNLFILKPYYEVTSFIRIEETAREETLSEGLNLLSFTESVKTDVTLQRLIRDLELKKHSINSLRANIKVDLIQDTNTIEITVKDNDPVLAKNIANMLSYRLGMRIDISERSREIVSFGNELKAVNDEIVVTEGQINQTKQQLENTPEKLVTNKALVDAPTLHMIAGERSGNTAEEIGGINYVSEEINPVYVELKRVLSEKEIALQGLLDQKKLLEKHLIENRAAIAKMDGNPLVNIRDLEEPQRFLDGLVAVFINPALVPEEPSGPNKIVNIVLVTFVFFVIGAMYLVFRYFWVKSVRSMNLLKSSG